MTYVTPVGAQIDRFLVVGHRNRDVNCRNGNKVPQHVPMKVKC